MKYTVIGDIHIGSSFSLKIPLQNLDAATTILNGDIYERRWCLKKNVENMRSLQKVISEHFKTTIGNHCFDVGQLTLIRENGIIFMHGHSFAENATKYESESYMEKEGCGYLAYFAMWIAGLLPVFKKVKKSELERAATFSEINGCHTIVLNHFHPRKLIDYCASNGVRVLVLPRGLTEIEL